MNIRFGNRTEETVRIYFEASCDPAIKDVLPQKAQSVEEAIDDYRKALLPGATSYGRTILADGAYVGDIWCYCIDTNDEPNAMLSYCVFEKSLWNRGIATAAECSKRTDSASSKSSPRTGANQSIFNTTVI